MCVLVRLCEDVGGGVGGGGGVGVECKAVVLDNLRPLSLHQADEGQNCYHHWRVRRSVCPNLYFFVLLSGLLYFIL